MVGVPAGICEMIDKELPNAITYRRRDFEQEAMMRELCRRIGVVLPARPSMSWPSGKAAVRVAVICNPSGAAILGTLAEALDETRVELIQDDQPRFHPFVSRTIIWAGSGLHSSKSVSNGRANRGWTRRCWRPPTECWSC